VTDYEAAMHAVLADPENDEPRSRFADFIRSSDPDRAKFIELQLEAAKAARAHGDNSRTDTDGPFKPLLDRNEAKWSRTLAKYAYRLRYDRGFVASMWIEPYMFLEYGEFLYANAPIVAVEFGPPGDGPMPFAELAASPLLAKLVAVTFSLKPDQLTQRSLELFLASPHLTSLLFVANSTRDAVAMSYTELAKLERVRQLLVFDVAPNSPGQHYRETDDEDMHGRPRRAWTGLEPEGVALEQQYGYLPWLHPNDNYADPVDVRWLVQHGKRPKRPVGSR
jgi:uncharacterized protein (TIGR02996 family)